MNELVLDGQRVYAETPQGEGRVRFIADNISKERTGIHARISIAWNTTLLAYSYLNIERDHDRTTLANKAWPLLPPPIKASYTKDSCKHELDIFTFRLWETFLGHVAPEQVNGSIDIGQPPFVLYPYVQKGAGTILFGPPGRGKSYVLLMMAVTIDSGDQDWWNARPHKVMFVNLERSRQSVLYRLARINLCLGYKDTRDIWMLNARGHTLADVRDSIRKAVEENGIEVICLDSISRAGMGDLTGNREANSIIDTLNRVAPTWLAVGHTPRGDDTHLFGGVHFDAGADIMVKLSSEARPLSLGIALEVTKANDQGKPAHPEFLALDFESETGLNCIRRPQASEFTELALKQKRTLLQEIQEYLALEGKASATTIAEALGRKGDRGNVSHLLNNRPEFIRLGRSDSGILFGLQS